MKAQIGIPAAAIRAHEELFTYWTSLRDGARLPARRDLDPAGMKRLLPTVSLIDVARRDPRVPGHPRRSRLNQRRRSAHVRRRLPGRSRPRVARVAG